MQENGVQFTPPVGISKTLQLSAVSWDTQQHYWQEDDYFARLLCQFSFETSGAMETNQL